MAGITYKTQDKIIAQPLIGGLLLMIDDITVAEHSITSFKLIKQ